MALVPLTIPPGVYRNGTDMQSAGRWRDASLVRWIDGTMQPVGGWAQRASVASDPIRGMWTWMDLGLDRYIACGSASNLYAVSVAGTVTDITPAGLTSGIVDAAANLGYGGGYYGTGYYGVARSDVGAVTEATTWSLDNWGETLVACSSADMDIYDWDLNVANNATAVSGAPTASAIVVTEERFLFALGAGGNPRKVQWCDREDNTEWTPSALTEAGDIELQTSGRIMQGIRTRGQTLILTDVDAHTATYQGPPFVYGFERVGSSCGAASRHAAAAVDAGVFWMGPRGFFVYAGGQVQPLACDVADYVFTDLNASQKSKVYAVTVAAFGEVWWHYPGEGSPECDSYVVYNYRENHWSIGTMGRTAGVDAGVFTTPIWADADGVIYNHESGHSRDNGDVFAESGPVQIGVGDNVLSARYLYPDEQTQGDVTVTFKTRFYPNGDQTTHGPYSMAEPTNVRFTGRQVAMRINGTGKNWRVGTMRVEGVAGGLR